MPADMDPLQGRQITRDAHKYASSSNADDLHHRLGAGASDAAPGSHGHNPLWTPLPGASIFGGGWDPPQYRVIKQLGIVQLRGLQAVTANTPINTVLATLPGSATPVANHIIGANADAFVSLNVLTTGVISARLAIAATYLSYTGLWFPL